MDPTIYTFGDPEIVREALLALATIFSSSEWVDGGNGFGLGGNLLAVALIGLIGILIAGINTQTIRVDYILTAFVLFAITFSIKTDVNIEDLQTGSVSVVADVPIGVAWVASLASGAAYDLTDTMSTALQRPGSPTSTLTASGFLNPLKTLLSLRGIEVKEFDPHLYKSIVEYYRFCIGKTQIHSPGTFSMREYLVSPDSWGYFTDDTKVQNWLTVYYDEANPGGITMGCYDANNNMDTRMREIADGTTDEAALYMRRTMGTKQFNTIFNYTDIDEAIQLTFRASLASVDFMAGQMLKRVHNDGEAWKVAEYGSSQAQYVATLTEAFETKAYQAASEGSMFLQFMIPMMGFFQFLFFSLPPLIALVMLAAPVQAPKLLGMYLLFGVWCYGWLPIATIINHYVQISTQNELDFGGVDVLGSAVYSISGFDSLYATLTTKLVIGANALAATPVILGAILLATPFAISNAAQRLGTGGSVNTSIGAPKLAENGPLMKRAALAASAAGFRPAAEGAAAFSTSQEKAQMGNLSIASTLSGTRSQGESFATQQRRMATATGRKAADRVISAASSSELESGQKRIVSSAYEEAIGAQWRDVMSSMGIESLGNKQDNQVQTAAGFMLGANGVKNSEVDTTSFTTSQQTALNKLMEKSSQIQAKAMDTVANHDEAEQDVVAAARTGYSEIREASQQAQQAEAAASDLSETASSADNLKRSHDLGVQDIAQVMMSNHTSAFDKMRARAVGNDLMNEFDSKVGEIMERSNPVGLDGKRGSGQLLQIEAGLLALDEMAKNNNVKAADALVDTLRHEAGLAIAPIADQTLKQMSGTGDIQSRLGKKQKGVKDTVNGATALRSAGLKGTSETELRAAESRVGGIRDSIDAAAREREDVNARWKAFESQVNDYRDEDRNGAAAAYAGSKRMFQAAARERENSWLAKANDWIKTDSGYDQEAFNRLNDIPSGTSTEAKQKGADLMWDLQGLVRGQQDINANPMQTYTDMLNQGFEPRVAAAGAFAEVGWRRPGAVETLIAGGLVGASASDLAGSIEGDFASKERVARQKGMKSAGARRAKLLFRAARFLGPAVGASTSLLMMSAYRSGVDEQGRTWDQELQDDLREGAKDMYGDQSNYAEFEKSLASSPPQNSQEMTNAITTFFEGTALYGEGAGQALEKAPSEPSRVNRGEQIKDIGEEINKNIDR